MRVTFLVDRCFAPRADPQFARAWDHASPLMEHHVVHAAREAGHETSVIVLRNDVRATLAAIRRTRPDVVFNLIEHYRDNRMHAAHVATLLAAEGWRVTGCDGPASLLTCDKVASTRLVAAQGLCVPRTISFPLGKRREPRDLRFPLLVKPRFEDGSAGISLRSLVHDGKALAERVASVHRRYRQDALAQEYIDGPEVSVGVLSTRPLRALPAREMVFGGRLNGGPPFATELVKESKRYAERWDVFYRRADLPPRLERAIAKFAMRVYRLFRMRGYGRVDLRIAPDGRPVFLEANVNPDIRPRTFGVMAQWGGIEYVEFIDLLVRLAS